MGTQFSPLAWSTFFSAQIGASAGLAGLIFVAVSIDLKQIVAFPHLVGRSAKALFILTGVLLISTCCLAPGQPRAALAGELLGLGLILWIAVTLAHRAAMRGNTYISRGQRILHSLLAQLSLLPYLLAGASLLAGFGGGPLLGCRGDRRLLCSRVSRRVDAIDRDSAMTFRDREWPARMGFRPRQHDGLRAPHL